MARWLLYNKTKEVNAVKLHSKRGEKAMKSLMIVSKTFGVIFSLAIVASLSI